MKASKTLILIMLAFITINSAHGVGFQDPDVFIEGVQIVDGKFTQAETDLIVAAPDPLVLKRFYDGYWRLMPQAYMIVGGDQIAFTGEPVEGILKYKDDKVDFAKGMTNTYKGEITGKTNLENNRLTYKQEICEIILGDGTKRIYKLTQEQPANLFWTYPKVLNAQTYRLISEKLPSGNVIFYFYENGNIALIEMKDATEKRLHAWIRFNYRQEKEKFIIEVKTSDEKNLEYHFQRAKLKQIKGSHCISVSYEYENENLTKKLLPEGRYLSIDYDELNRVKALKKPSTFLEEPEIIYRFEYGKGITDVFNAQNIRTRYIYDENELLISIEENDKSNQLYRETRKYWEKNKLKAVSLADGKRAVLSHRVFAYDKFGNLKSELLYGNLTGEKEIIVKLDSTGKVTNSSEVELHEKKYKYSQDGLNLLIETDDAKNVSLRFNYKEGTNRLTNKFLQKDEENLKRTFYGYDSDGVCTYIIEDDGYQNIENDLSGVTERHITLIKPKQTIPGIGLPEVIEKKSYDTQNKKNVLASKTTYSYYPQGQPKSISFYGNTESPIYTINKTYTNLGQIKSETDPKGHETIYDYDHVGNLILTTIPHQKRVIERKYDLKNRLYQITEKADGLELVERHEFDCLGNRTALTDRFGHTTQYGFDDFNRAKQITYPKVRNEDNNEIAPTTSYTYDIFDNILTTTDPKGYQTTQHFTIRKKPSKIVYPDETTELFKYDPEGSLHRSLSRDNQVTVYEYDDQGRLSYQEKSKKIKDGMLVFLKGHSYEYNAFRLLREKDKNLGCLELYTRLYHDPAGRIIKKAQYDGQLSENNPSSRISEFAYDALGRMEREKIWFGTQASDYFYEVYNYNLLGQVQEKRIEDAKNKILLQRMFDYDQNGNCVEEYAFHNGQKISVSKTLYDPFGEPISYIDSYGNKTTISINHKGNTVQKVLTDPIGTETELEFDALGRLTSFIRRDKQGFLLSSQHFGYDASGNKCIETNDVIFQGRSTGTQINKWIYGPMNRLEELIEAADSAEEIRTKFAYNKYGKLKTKIISGIVEPITYSYHAQNGWLSKIEHKSNDREKAILNTFEYDEAGNIIVAKSNNEIEIKRDYNVFGDIIGERVEHNIEDCFHTKLSYNYDRLGRITKITLPDQSSIRYTYDGIFGRLIERLSPTNKAYYQHIYDCYDVQGKLVQETTPIGTITWIYDRKGRKIGQQSEYFSEVVPDLGYSPLNCLLAIERKGIFPVQNGQYTYDSLAQLSSENTPQYKTYTYDSLGNSRVCNREEVKFNNLNQISSSQYSFDEQGNISKKHSQNTETKFTHNILSQLIKVEKEDGAKASYLHDPFGRRIVKEIFSKKGNSLSYFLTFYHGYQELGCVNGNEKIQQLRVPGLRGSAISQDSVAFELTNQTYIPLHDISGNVMALIEPFSKSLVESYTYSAFGERVVHDSKRQTSANSPTGNPWGYKEKRFDEETQLVHFGFRLYDPEIHRWTTRDPLGSFDGPNHYCFLHNNPLIHFDDLGLATESSQEDTFQEYFYGEVEKHCYCEQHRTCKRGGDIGNNRLGGIATGISDYCTKTAEYFLQTPLAFSFIPELKNAYENAIQSNLHQLHKIWDEGLNNIIGFDPSHEQTLYYKNATVIGLTALDMIRGGVKDPSKGWSFFKKSEKEATLTPVWNKTNLSNAKPAEQSFDLFSTIERIQKGIKFPHRNDGAVFRNREKLLPKQHSTYYREYVHPTPGIDGPGPQRIIIGEAGELFYSPDHYQTFIQIR